jgi:hypothetical protein
VPVVGVGSKVGVLAGVMLRRVLDRQHTSIRVVGGGNPGGVLVVGCGACEELRGKQDTAPDVKEACLTGLPEAVVQQCQSWTRTVKDSMP